VALAPSRSDASAASALDCGLARQDHVRREEDGPASVRRDRGGRVAEVTACLRERGPRTGGSRRARWASARRARRCCRPGAPNLPDYPPLRWQFTFASTRDSLGGFRVPGIRSAGPQPGLAMPEAWPLKLFVEKVVTSEGGTGRHSHSGLSRQVPRRGGPACPLRLLLSCSLLCDPGKVIGVAAGDWAG
jgi:hypothetical protein